MLQMHTVQLAQGQLQTNSILRSINKTKNENVNYSFASTEIKINNYLVTTIRFRNENV